MALTEGPKMKRNLYSVESILEPKEYNVRVTPHELIGQTAKLAAAGVKVNFPARLPFLQAEERRKLLQEYGIPATVDDEYLKDRRIHPEAEEEWQKYARAMLQFSSEQYLPSFAELNGIYQVTNIDTHNGELKAIQPQRTWSKEGEKRRLLKEDCLVYLDPVTAETLGMTGEAVLDEIQNKTTRQLLEEIRANRDNFYLSPKDLAWLLDQHARGKLR